MSNKLGQVVMIFSLSISPAFGKQTVASVFKQIDEQGLQRWHQKSAMNADGERKQALAEIRVLNADIKELTPTQLVALIELCRKKIHEIPSDSKHERYSDYHVQAILFSIRRLGDQNSLPAKQALDKVKPIISGAAHLEEAWDEAKAKQDSKSK